MPQAVTVYRWDDPGAPQTTDRTQISLMNVLRKCLVDGYGNKEPLGWSIPFEDTARGITIFRNDSSVGSGGFLRVNYSTSPAAGGLLTIRPLRSCVDIDDISDQGYFHHMAAISNCTTWVLIGTKTGFYFITSNPTAPVAGYDNRYDFMGFFGDFESFIDNDAGRFIAITVARNVGNSTGDVSSWNSSLSMIWYTEVGSLTSHTSMNYAPLSLAKANNDSGRDEYRVASLSFYNNNSTIPGVQSNNKMGIYNRPLILRRGLSLISPDTDIVGGVNNRYSMISPIVRGTLPGMIFEVIPRYGTTSSWPIVENLNGKDHWLLRSRTECAFVWVNMEEW